MHLFGYFLCVDLSTMLLFEIIGDSLGFEKNSGFARSICIFSALDKG